ncbi:MAG: molybdate ABC transporter substrate-binding protein [Rhodospirillaceae bacterium]
MDNRVPDRGTSPLRAMSSRVSIAAALFMSTTIQAAEIRVYSGGAPQEALKVLAPEFERATGHRLAFTYGVVGEIRKRLGAREKADVILLPVPLMDSMEKANAVRPGSRILLSRVGIGVVVREGDATPDISTADALRNTLAGAGSIVYPDPDATPSGKHLAAVLGKLGIADRVKSNTTVRNAIDGGVALVASGSVQIGMFLVSKITPVKGVKLVGLLPSELQNYVVYAGSVAVDSPAAEPALAFLKFLTSAAAEPHWKAAGFEPLGTSR